MSKKTIIDIKGEILGKLSRVENLGDPLTVKQSEALAELRETIHSLDDVSEEPEPDADPTLDSPILSEGDAEAAAAEAEEEAKEAAADEGKGKDEPQA